MATMNVANMRTYVSNAYEGDEWKTKVSKMSDGQVIAIYHSLLGRKKKHPPKEKEEYRQMTIFDYI